MTPTFDPKAKRQPPAIPTTGTDWGDVAEVHFIEAQLCAFELDDELHAISVLDTRLANGKAYREQHPDSEEAYRLYRDLEEQRRDRLLTVSILRRRIWEACRTTAMALGRAERPRRAALIDHIGLTDWYTNDAIWERLMGRVPPPEGKSEDVEPIIRVEPWLLPLMQERLKEREYEG